MTIETTEWETIKNNCYSKIRELQKELKNSYKK